ncbi:LysR substrate-binding domain-containing protein [Paracoccus sp. Z330]|uniref:LysR substrate-binding domain-containing protein n=1 Tax=Paracoccus onchidii TaxID=3017813 RepID=A0ABT4ZG53_9RHOB|nr:LysR family transcriptional regulator [Paracoccus onchidii]MDB6178310.1 LysR substrate-binding domain-containing protein [Paracoccus onchidii]
MTLEQLRIFIAVAERQHMTQAAASLNLTQSATSAAIAALEQRHAVRLFDRVGRRIVLTDAGRQFLNEARAVLGRAEQAERLLADLAQLRRGTLRLGASQTVANYWLPEVMQRFHRDHPGFSLSLETGNTQEIAAMVLGATIDLGFVEGIVDMPALSLTELTGDEMALVVAPDHPWAHTAPHGPDQLRATEWVLREPGSGTRAVWDELLGQHGLDAAMMRIAYELPSNEAVRTAVEAGGGAAILSTLVIQPSRQTGRIACVDLDLPVRKFFALRHKERRLSLAEARFLDCATPETAGQPNG